MYMWCVVWERRDPEWAAELGWKLARWGSMLDGCFLFCSCEWALCALRPAAESWTASERLLTAGKIKEETLSVQERNGNNDLCLEEISPYHLPFSSPDSISHIREECSTRQMFWWHQIQLNTHRVKILCLKYSILMKINKSFQLLMLVVNE